MKGNITLSFSDPNPSFKAFDSLLSSLKRKLLEERRSSTIKTLIEQKITSIGRGQYTTPQHPYLTPHSEAHSDVPKEQVSHSEQAEQVSHLEQTEQCV